MTKFFKTTIALDIFTAEKPAEFDETFWNRLRESLAGQEGNLRVGTALDTKEITRQEAEDDIEDLAERLPEVTCSLCGNLVPEETAHRHRGGWVGADCCWDERLRSAE